MAVAIQTLLDIALVIVVLGTIVLLFGPPEARGATKSKPPSKPPPTPPTPSCLPKKGCHRCESYAFDEQVLRADMEALRASLGRSEAALADAKADADDGQTAAEMSMAWGQEWEREYRAAWAEVERLLDVVIAYRNAMSDGADYFCPECRLAAEIVGHDDDCPIGMAMDRLLDSTRAAIEAGEEPGEAAG